LVAYSASVSRSLGDYIIHDAGLYMNGRKSLIVNAKSKKDAKATFDPIIHPCAWAIILTLVYWPFRVDPHLIIPASPLL
jgi:hypothetical protein